MAEWKNLRKKVVRAGRPCPCIICICALSQPQACTRQPRPQSLYKLAGYALLLKLQLQFAQCADTFVAICSLKHADTLIHTQFCGCQVIPYSLCLETGGLNVDNPHQLILLQHYRLLLDNSCQDNGAALLVQVEDCCWSLHAIQAESKLAAPLIMNPQTLDPAHHAFSAPC